MRKNSSTSRKVISEINITPFVDVLLVVLIIFMVTAPMLENGFDVNLPKTVKNSIQNQQDQQVVISLDSKSALYVNDKKVTLRTIDVNLRAYNKDFTRVFIKADENVKYSEVMGVMNLLKKNGFVNISLVTETD